MALTRLWLDELEVRLEPELLIVPEALRRAFVAALAGVFGEAYVAGRQAAAQAVDIRARRLEFQEVSPYAPLEGLAWYRNYILRLAGVYEEALLKRVKEEVIKARLEGLSIPNTMLRLEEVLPDFAWSRLENIARTETARIYERGQWDLFSQHPRVAGYQIHAILDARTTPICEMLHGRVIPIGEGTTLWPPYHYQCRTTVSPVLIDEIESGAVKWDPPPPGVRPMAGFGTVVV